MVTEIRQLWAVCGVLSLGQGIAVIEQGEGYLFVGSLIFAVALFIKAFRRNL